VNSARTTGANEGRATGGNGFDIGFLFANFASLILMMSMQMRLQQQQQVVKGQDPRTTTSATTCTAERERINFEGQSHS